MKNFTILAVDDILANRISLQYLIEEYCEDIDVILANGGEEALKITYSLKIDLIVLDIQMPGMDGFETATYLKKNPKTTNIPIIFLTAAFKKDEFLHKGFEVGAVDYLTKPIEDQQFINKIKLYKEIVGKTKELEAANLQLNEALQQERELKKTIQKQHNEIMEQNKMAALGEMISNIAHQWRQPLSMISTCSSGLSVKKEMGILEDTELYEKLEKITEITTQLSNTIESFRGNVFDDISTECNLAHFIQNIIESQSNLLKQKNIEVIQNLENEITTYIFPNSLQQSLVNILTNAIEILENIPNNKYIFVNLHKIDDEIIITIEDNGGGMKTEDIYKAFEPYFTTKHKKQGIGLGLTNVYNNIITNLQGKIEIENAIVSYKNEKYKGLKVTITLNKYEK